MPIQTHLGTDRAHFCLCVAAAAAAAAAVAASEEPSQERAPVLCQVPHGDPVQKTKRIFEPAHIVSSTVPRVL